MGAIQQLKQADSITLTLPQSRFFTSKARYTCFCGGFGSGKSHALFTKMLSDKFAHPKVDLMYGAPTYSLIRDIAYDRLENMLESMHMPYQLNKAEQILRIENYGKIIFRTLERPERLIGFQVFRAYLDELDTMRTSAAEEVWNKIIARCRQVDPDKPEAENQIFVATTPEGFSFVYQRWVKLIDDTNRSRYRLIKAPSYSNKFLPPGYVEDLRVSYTAALVNAYIEGDFVNMKNKSVYSNFDRTLNDSKTEIRNDDVLYVGMDFNVLNMNAIIHVLREGNPVAVAEITRAKDTPDMIDILNFRYRSEGRHHPILIYPDASGKNAKSLDASKSDIKLLRDAGFTIRARSKNPNIKDRVNSMNGMFRNSKGEIRYRVNVDKCPEYVMALEQQVYDENGMPEKNKGDNVDDLNDAGGYYIHYEFPIVRKDFSVESSNHF